MNTKLIFFISALLFLVSPAWADAESERANLAKMVGEIDVLSQTLNEYKSGMTHGRRYRFDYDSLSQDLQNMRNGIVEYINKDLSMAREIPPLSEHYILAPGEK